MKKVKRSNSIQCRLFVGMDGTLNYFNNNIESIDAMYSKGYFSELEPMRQVVDAIKEFLKHDKEVYILTSIVASPYALAEKKEWLDKFLPEIDSNHIIFVPYGKDKTKYIDGEIRKTDFLLDDYDHNLIRWSKKGTSIKLVNNLNDKGGWDGEKIYYNDYYLGIAYSIRSIQNKSILKEMMYNKNLFIEYSSGDRHIFLEKRNAVKKESKSSVKRNNRRRDIER